MVRHGRAGQNQVITADEVSERVIAAFAIDRRLPRVAKPKAPGGSHPPVWRSEAERLEVAQARKADGIQDDEPVRIHPSEAEIAAAEAAFAWLPPVAAANREAYDALRIWAAREAQPVKTKGAKSLRSIAADLGILPMQITRGKNRALALIAERLNSTLH
jgi:hypothetical protein